MDITHAYAANTLDTDVFPHDLAVAICDISLLNNLTHDVDTAPGLGVWLSLATYSLAVCNLLISNQLILRQRAECLYVSLLVTLMTHNMRAAMVLVVRLHSIPATVGADRAAPAT